MRMLPKLYKKNLIIAGCVVLILAGCGITNKQVLNPVMNKEIYLDLALGIDESLPVFPGLDYNLGMDNFIYVLPSEKAIYKYDFNGNLRTKVPLPMGNIGVWVVDNSGNIYATSKGYLYKIDGGGKIIWKKIPYRPDVLENASYEWIVFPGNDRIFLSWRLSSSGGIHTLEQKRVLINTDGEFVKELSTFFYDKIGVTYGGSGSDPYEMQVTYGDTSRIVWMDETDRLCYINGKVYIQDVLSHVKFGHIVSLKRYGKDLKVAEEYYLPISHAYFVTPTGLFYRLYYIPKEKKCRVIILKFNLPPQK